MSKQLTMTPIEFLVSGRKPYMEMMEIRKLV